MKTIIIGAIVAGWIAMAVDFVRRNDEHHSRIMDCMTQVRHEQNISTYEAYLVCEKE